MALTWSGSRQKAPLRFGLTSPRLEEAKAATKDPSKKRIMKHIISNGYNSRFSYFADETAFGIHALLKHDAGPALVVATDEVVGVEHGHPVDGEPDFIENTFA